MMNDDMMKELQYLRDWKESAMKQLGKSDALRDILPIADYWGWDIYDAAIDYIKKLREAKELK
jgi:hypothetical protein